MLWYTGRLFWYALPWSIFAVGAWVSALRRSSRTASADRRGREDEGDSRGLLFAALAAGVFIAAFAVADRRADRFIFPAYFLVGAAGAIAAIRWSPRLSRVVDVLDRPWVPAAFWLGLFLLRFASGSHLPRLMLR